VVFTSISAISYEHYVAEETFLDPDNVDYNEEILSIQSANNREWADRIRNIRSVVLSPEYENITAADCLNAYATTFQTSRSNVLVITDSNETYMRWGLSSISNLSSDRECPWSPFEWVCNMGRSCSGETCRSKLSSVRDNWHFEGNRAIYCLSKPEEERCRLNFHVTLAIPVLVANLTKAVLLMLIALFPHEGPLLVLGDAIASFLAFPDNCTRGMCSLTREKVTRFWHSGRLSATPWVDVRKRWLAAQGKPSWIFYNLLYRPSSRPALTCPLAPFPFPFCEGGLSSHSLFLYQG